MRKLIILSFSTALLSLIYSSPQHGSLQFQIEHLPFAVIIPANTDATSGQVQGVPFAVKSMEDLQQPFAMAEWIEKNAGVTVEILYYSNDDEWRDSQLMIR